MSEQDSDTAMLEAFRSALDLGLKDAEARFFVERQLPALGSRGLVAWVRGAFYRHVLRLPCPRRLAEEMAERYSDKLKQVSAVEGPEHQYSERLRDIYLAYHEFWLAVAEAPTEYGTHQQSLRQRLLRHGI